MARYAAKLLGLILVAALFGAGCAGPAPKPEVSARIYTYEKKGAGGDFTIEIREDGTFSYYEGPLSSYRGAGKWKLDGDKLILRDVSSEENPRVHYFRVEGEDLVFLAKDSDGFVYVQVSEGERFGGPPAVSEK